LADFVQRNRFLPPLNSLTFLELSLSILADFACSRGFAESIFPANCPNIVAEPKLIEIPAIPVALASSLPVFSTAVKQVSIGQSHVLLLTHTGDVYSLGSASNLQLGTGAKNNVRVPRLILSGKEVYSIACGRYHSLAVSHYGIVYSWGCSESGQCGQGNLDSEVFPKIISSLLTTVVGSLAAGSHHSIALSSITHSSISPDVSNFAAIEAEELKLKQDLLFDFPNGLKTAHLVQVAVERKNIIAAIAEKLRKEREEQATVTAEVKKMIGNTQEMSREIAKLGPSSSRETNEPEKRENVSFSKGAAFRKLIAEEEEEENQANLSSLLAASKEKSLLEAPTAATSSNHDSSLNILSLSNIDSAAQTILKATASHRALGGEEPDYEAYKNNRASVTEKLNLPKLNSGPSSRVPSAVHSHKLHQESKEFSHDASLPTLNDFSPEKALDSRRNLAHSASTPFIKSHNSRALSSSHSNSQLIASNRSAARLTSATATSRTNAAASFAPLAPRIEFIETTSNALAKVKNFIQTQPVSAQPQFTQVILKLKQDYNNIKAQVKSKELQVKKLNHELTLSRPNSEEQSTEMNLTDRLKDLHMKLVTLSTRLAEAEENRGNYELYIIRMKEEDLLLSKQSDQLKHSILELERQIAKAERNYNKLLQQSQTVQEEINKFSSDIHNFQDFSNKTVEDYRKVLAASVNQSRYAEKLQNNREKKLDSIKQAALDNLQSEVEALNESSAQYKAQLAEWTIKVEEYDKQFRIIAAVTGSNNAENITAKYYTNKQITDQIHQEIAEKEKRLAQLKENIEFASTTLKQLADQSTPTRWRDIIQIENSIGDKQQLLTRRTEESATWNSKLTQFLEGMQNMTKNAKRVLQQQANSEEEMFEEKELSSPTTQSPELRSGSNAFAGQVDIETRETVTKLLGTLQHAILRLNSTKEERQKVQKQRAELEKQWNDMKKRDAAASYFEKSAQGTPQHEAVGAENEITSSHTMPIEIPTLEELTQQPAAAST
jgi:hypothetical protein